MFKNLSARNKFKLLLAGFAISLLLVYSIAISGTLELYSKCNSLIQELEIVEKAPVEIGLYNKKLDELNRIISGKESELNFHEELLKFVSAYCKLNEVIIKNYPEGHKYVSNNYVVETNIITLEGSFNALIKLLYLLEVEKANGHISSVKFETIANHRTSVYKLNLIIYGQNIYNYKANSDNN